LIQGFPDISFVDLNEGKQWHYKPQADITAYDVAQLLELFTYAAIYHKERPIEWRLYLEKKNLFKHFVDTEIGQPYE
jgi:hypothetical protein